MQQCKIQRKEPTSCELDFLIKQLQRELLKLRDTKCLLNHLKISLNKRKLLLKETVNNRLNLLRRCSVANLKKDV
jgi:hypothetical protein